MDPLSIAAGVAGLVTLVLQVTKAASSYSESIIHGDRELRELLRELDGTLSVLQELDSFLRTKQIASTTFNKSSALESALTSCNDVVSDLRQRLDRLENSSFSRTAERLKWSFSKDEVYKTLATIKRCNSTFQFCLTLEGWSVRYLQYSRQSCGTVLYTEESSIPLTLTFVQ